MLIRQTIEVDATLIHAADSRGGIEQHVRREMINKVSEALLDLKETAMIVTPPIDEYPKTIFSVTFYAISPKKVELLKEMLQRMVSQGVLAEEQAKELYEMVNE